MRVLRFPESGPSVKMCFGFWVSFGLEWTKKAFFKENRKNGNWMLRHPVSELCYNQHYLYIMNKVGR